MVNNTLTKTKL
jgi:hypothetical protein